MNFQTPLKSSEIIERLSKKQEESFLEISIYSEKLMLILHLFQNESNKGRSELKESFPSQLSQRKNGTFAVKTVPFLKWREILILKR